MDNHSFLAIYKWEIREFPDRCKQNFDSASEVKEEAKLSFTLILQIFFLISQTNEIF